MDSAAYFDAVFFIAVAVGLFFLFKSGKTVFYRSTKFLLAGLLFFMLIYGFCLGMEWSGIAESLETLEDLVGALIPMWWAFVFYGFVREITHRDILLSEEKYRSLLANIPDVVWTVDQNDRITFISSNVETVCGYSPKEVYEGGDHFWFGKVHPDDVERVKKASEGVFEQGVALDVEYRIKRKDGEWIWVHDRSIGAYEKDGAKYADGVFCDVTERKRSLEDLERIFNLSGYMVCIATMDGYFSKVSPAFEDVLGYSSEDLLSRPFLDFVHPDDKAKTVAVMEEKLSAGVEVVDFENRYRCKDGGYKWLGWSSRPVVEEGIMFAIAHDITERKVAEEEVRATNERLHASNQQLVASEQQLRASNQQLVASERELRGANQQLRASNQQLAASEEDLRESRHLLDATINNSPAVIYVKDLEGRYLLVNESYERILDRSREEMLGKTDEDLFPKDVAAKFRANDHLALEADAPLEFEEVALHVDGELHTYISTKFSLRGSDGSLYAVCGISTDITERKRLEEQERKHHEQLVHFSRLTVAGELASGMAHELNQPLTAITIYAQACRRMIDSGNADSPKLREAAEEIASQAMRGGEIIRRMRGFVRKQSPQRVSVDFNEIVREAIDLVQIQAKSSEVALQLEFSEEPLMVLADTVRIQQVLVNLFQNGFDAMDDVAACDRVLTVRTSKTSEGTVEVAVEDRGGGLSSEDSERIFESFYTTKSDGLGIGLSISRSIVEEHDGHIWAEPNADKGAIFRFSLPSE